MKCGLGNFPFASARGESLNMIKDVITDSPLFNIEMAYTQSENPPKIGNSPVLKWPSFLLGSSSTKLIALRSLK
jgi:hypothetical protein